MPARSVCFSPHCQVAILLRSVLTNRVAWLQVGKSCAEGLDGQRGVKSILAMYRAQNRGVPTTNSPFVDGALEPLSSLTDRARGIQHVPEAAVAEWADFVVGIVCQRFLEAATEVVTSAKKTAAGPLSTAHSLLHPCFS